MNTDHAVPHASHDSQPVAESATAYVGFGTALKIPDDVAVAAPATEES